MGGTQQLQQDGPDFPPLLLCFSGNEASVTKLLNEQFCGKPLLFHQLLRFHTLGFRNILLSVEAVPGALVAVIDELAVRGVAVKFVRSPAEVLAEIGQQTHFLVSQADVWFSSEMIRLAAVERKNLLFTVEERQENQLFERIDLNSRWLGLGLVDRTVLESIHDLPEDWDMGSSILRQALQQQPELKMLRQSSLVEGQAAHLRDSVDFQDIFSNAHKPKGWVESLLFNGITRKLALRSWSSSVARNFAVWAFPALAILCLSLVAMELPVLAALAALLGAWAADVRSYAMTAEYQQTRYDAPAVIAWVVLALSLAACLYLDGMVPFDALLFAGVVAGLLLQSTKLQGKTHLSPMLIAAFILAGAALGAFALSVKLLVAAQLVALLASSTPISTPRLKAN
jgi:hypothetical protein